MATVRNPLSAFIITIIAAFAISLLVAILIRFVFLFFIPITSGGFELQLIVLSFSLVAVGAVAGRFSIIGSMGFVGSLVGGFFAMFLFQTFLFPTDDWLFLLSLFWGALIGVGGLLTGKLGLRRISRALSAMPQQRRCGRCGARVGLTAQKCWSCRAFLPPV